MLTKFGVLIVLAVTFGRTDSFTCIPPCQCNGVNITCADGEFMNVPEFETINGANIVDLSGNEIEEIDNYAFNWKGIEQLQFLYLNINSIVYIDENAFEIFRNLEYLDLSNNCLEMLPSRMFQKNNRLKTLLLAGNFFGTNVPVIESTSLEELDISFSKLSHFSYTNIKHLPNLKQLNLQANNMVYLDSSIFDRHKDISVVLTYNFWACNCSTIDLHNWAVQNTGRIILDNPLKCINKKNIYIDLFNHTSKRMHKESCYIDENSIGEINIKELSLVKDNAIKTDTSRQEYSKNDVTPAGVLEDENENDFFNKNIELICTAIVLLIVIFAIVLGIIIGWYFSNRRFNRNRRHRRSSLKVLKLYPR